jgi:hypothetical protein
MTQHFDADAMRLGQRSSRSLESFGHEILPKLRSGSDLKTGLKFSVTVPADSANGIAAELSTSSTGARPRRSREGRIAH